MREFILYVALRKIVNLDPGLWLTTQTIAKESLDEYRKANEKADKRK